MAGGGDHGHGGGVGDTVLKFGVGCVLVVAALVWLFNAIRGDAPVPNQRASFSPTVQSGSPGVRYTGRSCIRNDGSTGREGYNGGQLGCWRY